MSDRQRNYITGYLPAENSTKGHKKPNYARLYADLLHSPAFQDLTPTAQRLYADLLIATKGAAECSFTKSAAMAAGYVHQSFVNGIRDLEQHGFITAKRYKHYKNVYSLSDDWKRWKKPP